MRRIVLDQRDRVAAWVFERLSGDARHTEKAYAMGVEEDGELIAGIAYDTFTGRNIFMHVAALPGKNWVTRELLWHAFNYPFNVAGVERITGPVRETNLAAVRFDTHLGFVEECRLRGAEQDGSDTIMFVMWKNDCRYLGARHVRSI